MVVRHHWRIALSPEHADRCLDEHLFDDDLSRFLRMLFVSGILAALFQFIMTMSFAFITLVRSGSTIDWWPLINVSSALAAGGFFFMLFTGTVVLFVLALILHLLLSRKLIRIMHAIVLASSPLVLFAWIPILAPGVALWSFVLAVRLIRRPERNQEVAARE